MYHILYPTCQLNSQSLRAENQNFYPLPNKELVLIYSGRFYVASRELVAPGTQTWSSLKGSIEEPLVHESDA